MDKNIPARIYIKLLFYLGKITQAVLKKLNESNNTWLKEK